METVVLDPARIRGGADEVDDPRWALATWACVAVAVAFHVVTILRGSWAWLVDQLPDDAFYYLEIARHLGAGDGATFDGINQTNGFHPLWQFILVPLAMALPGDAALVRAAMLLGVALGVGGVVLVARFVRPVVGGGAAALGALLAIHGDVGTWWLRNGMESSLLVFALSLLLVALGRFDRRRDPRSALLVGLACGAVVLARMDFALVVGAVPLVLAVRVRRWWPLVRSAIGAAAVAGPVLAWELLAFGHVLSVSGTVKLAEVRRGAEAEWGGMASPGYLAHAGGAAVDVARSVGRDLGGTVFSPGGGFLGTMAGYAFVIVGAAGCVLLARRRREERAGAARTDAPNRGADAGPGSTSGVVFAVATVGGMVLAKTVVDVLVMPDWAAMWYSAPLRVAVGMILGIGTWEVLVRLATAGGRRALAVGLAVVLLLALPVTAWGRSATDATQGASWQQTLVQAGDWVRSAGPDGRYGAFDAGVLGYRLDGERTVVNLDGLVNDYDYARFLGQQPSLRARLAHQGIDVLVNRLSAAERAELDCARPLWRSPEPAIYDGVASYVYVLDVRTCR